MKHQRVAVLGLGKIGSILLDGLLKAGLPPASAVATVRHAERAQALAAKRPVPVGTDNRAAVRGDFHHAQRALVALLGEKAAVKQLQFDGAGAQA